MEKSDFNIEFAHVEFAYDGQFDKDEVYKSGSIAKYLYNAITERGKSCSVSLLIDDKNTPAPMQLNWISPLIYFASQRLSIDYICFESRIHLYKERLINMTLPQYRRQVERNIHKYVNSRGQTACSHDIAIWHLIRLGYINHLSPNLIIPVGSILHEELPYFKSNYVVSVLSDTTKYNRTHEDLADRKILQYCVVPEITNKIKRIYFDDSDLDSAFLEAVIKEILEPSDFESASSINNEIIGSKFAK